MTIMIFLKTNLKLSLSVVFVLIHFSSSAVLRNRTNHEPGLYFPGDDVSILTIQNFNTSIYNSDRAWMIEFYSNWCGFCQRAAPRYRAFATDVKGWSDLVVVAALDCANEDNAPVCEYFRITRYPTFRYIHEKYMEDPERIGLPIVADSHTNFSEHRNNLINIMRMEQTEGRGRIFPDLQPFTGALRDIFNNTNAQFGILIVQDNNDTVGPSVIMDFHKVKEIVVKYSDNDDSPVRSDSLPSVFYVESNGYNRLLNLSSLDRQGIKNAIRETLFAKQIEVPYEILRNITITEIHAPVQSSKEDVAFRNKIKAMGDVVFQLDLENALRYSLKIEVGGNTDIQGEKLESLKKYLNILVKYFPFAQTGKDWLKEIKRYVNSGNVVHGTVLNEMVKIAEEPAQHIFSGPPQWIGCRGSDIKFRGYPCGMWKMFHFLTVTAALNDTTTDSNTSEVLDAMHGYIKNFFGCEDCSVHFQEMAKRRNISNVMSSKDAVLWLWKAHNEVNKRLAGDPTEDPEYKKIEFPSRENCPACRKTDGSWNEDEVTKYLYNVYKLENIKYTGIDPQISHLNMGGDSVSKKSVSKAEKILSNSITLALCGFVLFLKFMLPL